MEKRAIWHNKLGNRIRSTSDGMSTNFTYVRGNLLAGVDSNVLYEYNKDGARFQKIVDGVVTKYFLDGHRIMGENRGTDTIRYFYDIDGLCGIRYNGQNYNVVRDALGNVVAITQGVEIRARYEYDSLGNCKVYNLGNSTIGDVNPFRWKGHYFDTETGFYYINGRYYDPQTASFLDAESVSAVFADSDNPLALDRNGIACVNTFAFAINATNVFTHVEMFADIDYDINANKPWWEIAWNAVVNWFAKTIHAITKWYDSIPNWLKFTIGAVCFTIAVVLTILTDGAVLPLFIELGIGVVLSVAVNVISALVTNQDVGAAIWDGIAEGVLWGGITLCISAAIKYFSLPQKIRRSVKKYIDDHAHSLEDANKILNSFEGKIRLKTSRGNLTCYRYYDDIDAFARGRYLTNAPTDNPIVDLVLHNNKATYLAKWNLPKGTKYLVGKIARSPTGAIQIFVGDSSWLVLP